ncbi:hydrogenase expression/formation protein HypE [bacterium]|nr:hydrogenase expression/formation protein HypE [bacterium]
MNEQQMISSDCRSTLAHPPTVQMAHGSGGRMMHELIHSFFHAHFTSEQLQKGDDAATLTLGSSRVAFTTDSYVVQPIFFPGGDIGDLAINGTINDLCMCGARPLYLSVGFILEEGLAFAELERILHSMAAAADKAGVRIVTGDTKVVDHGKADQLFINTAGIGVLEHDHEMGARCLQPGDRILLSGPVGQHGLAVLSQRQGLEFSGEIISDTAPLHELTDALLTECGAAVHALRDPTRGGVAAVLNEWAEASGVEIRVAQNQIPVLPAVQSGCALLGLDPLSLANEGKMLAVVAPERAERALQVLRSHPLAPKAVVIGEVRTGAAGLVSLRTELGAWRVLAWPSGELLPRIC